MIDILERLGIVQANLDREGLLTITETSDFWVDEAAVEIRRLRADLREANEAIRELQQEACNRAGVPMPSQRPVVDKLTELIRQIAVNHDAEWGRQMAREHLGMGPAEHLTIWQRIRNWFRSTI